MGFFNWKKKEELSYKFLVPYFEDVSQALVEFNTGDDIDDDKRCGLVKIFISSSALVCASYHVKHYIAFNEEIPKKVTQELAQIIPPFFDFMCGVTLRVAEKETGKSYNKDEWYERCYDEQHQRFKKYALAILETIKKGTSTSGADICCAVTEDLYNEEIYDIILAGKLMSTSLTVNKN